MSIAFDIDETVTLTLTYATEYTSPFLIGLRHERRHRSGLHAEVPPAAASRQVSQLALDRARFAGQGTQGADIAIGTRDGMAVCDIKVERSNTTKAPTGFGLGEGSDVQGCEDRRACRHASASTTRPVARRSPPTNR